MTTDWLPDRLQTIKNLVEVSEILINLGKTHLLPTVLEYLYWTAQDIVEDSCVVEEEQPCLFQFLPAKVN